MRTKDDVLTEITGLSHTTLELCVARGWVKPTQHMGAEMFLDIDVARLRLVQELRSDMGLNDEAVPVVLALIDQVHDLRRTVHRLAEELAAARRETPARRKRQIPVSPRV